MKKLLIISLLCLATVAQAQHRPYPHHHHHPGGLGWGWIVPAIVGGAVVYGATRPNTPPPPTVIYVPQGYPPAPAGFHYEQILDANCSCYRWVLIQG